MGVLAVVVFILVHHPLKAHRIYLRACRLNMLLLLFCSKFSAIRANVYNERRRETKILKVTICGGGALFYLEER